MERGLDGILLPYRFRADIGADSALHTGSGCDGLAAAAGCHAAAAASPTALAASRGLPYADAASITALDIRNRT